MKLYCIRHGQPLAPTAHDPDPALSDQGERDIASIAQHLHSKHINISYCYSSYKQRAKQTADIFYQTMQLPQPPEVMTQLDPSKPVELLYDELSHWTDDTLLVSHMPYINQFVSKLLGAESLPQFIKFSPGTMVCLERGAGDTWQLAWALSPQLI